MTLMTGTSGVVSSNQPAENVANERQAEQLLFLVQELGSFKKVENSEEEVYVPGPTCDKAAKDIAKYCIRRLVLR